MEIWGKRSGVTYVATVMDARYALWALVRTDAGVGVPPRPRN